MADIFISYASQDRERARDLAAALQAEGWSVWWDRDIKVGQSFDQVIETALDSAKCVVVLWSKGSISSEWVKNEAAAAAERGVLVPALIEAVRPPLEFRRKQTAALIGWANDRSHAGFRSLADGIGAVTGSLPATQPKESGGRPLRGGRGYRRWFIGSGAIIVPLLAGGIYLALRGDRNALDPANSGSALGPGLAAGVFEFKWPGIDCWEILRGAVKVTNACGGSRQALEAGRYTIKPEISAVFLPFEVVVNPNGTTTVDAMGGVLDLQWPGADCWEIYRAEVKVASSCGRGKQALQSGGYTVKPANSNVFQPFHVAIKTNTVTTADGMGGVLDFKWPGSDCWEIYRRDVKVVSSCGGGKQALQSGTYTLKPVSGAVFKPFSFRVSRNQTVTVP